MKMKLVQLSVAVTILSAAVFATPVSATDFMDCCDRQLSVLESQCTCGVHSYACWDNGRGGCSTWLMCSKCV